MKDITRWQQAQQAEAKAWSDFGSGPGRLTDRIQQEALERLCKYTSMTEAELKEIRILEIGGAIVERAFDEPDMAPKLVVDPLFPFMRYAGHKDKSTHRIKAMGESLPLADNSVDLCWTENTLDHVLSPAAMLQEIWRILRPQGTLIISCHTFPALMKASIPLLNKLDRPHPNHYTSRILRTMLESRFKINAEFDAQAGILTPLRKYLKNNTAVALGVRHIYFRCTPLKG